MRSLGVAFTAVAAVLLAGCTVSDAVDGIKSGCKFKANQQDVAILIVKVGGAINPVFGVAVNTVDGVVNLVCASVTAKAKAATVQRRHVKRVATVIRLDAPSVGQLSGLHATPDPLDLKSGAALVMDQDTNEILFSKNSQAVVPIASLSNASGPTKLFWRISRHLSLLGRGSLVGGSCGGIRTTAS